MHVSTNFCPCDTKISWGVCVGVCVGVRGEGGGGALTRIVFLFESAAAQAAR